MMRVESPQVIYDHLVCEFGHWDVCTKGLCRIDGDYFVCLVHPEYETNEDYGYRLLPVELDDECWEYLEDYAQAYQHWWHIDGQRCSYDGRPLGWFSEKWNRRNPIVEKAKVGE